MLLKLKNILNSYYLRIRRDAIIRWRQQIIIKHNNDNDVYLLNDSIKKLYLKMFIRKYSLRHLWYCWKSNVKYKTNVSHLLYNALNIINIRISYKAIAFQKWRLFYFSIPHDKILHLNLGT